MKILLISGHGAGQPGATGNGCVEADLTREITSLLANKLSNFVDVDVYPQSNNAYIDLENGKPAVNFTNYNYVLEVHFNAFNKSAKGTEIYVTSKENGTSVEQAIMDGLGKYFIVRGVKRKDFYVINSIKKKGVSCALLETCFIDNKEDMDTYQKNKDGIIQAIVDGIKKGFGLEETKPTLQCDAHIENIGWTGYKDTSKQIIGTEGQGKRLEAIKFKANNGLDIEYRVHIENIGWQDWKKNEEVAGTTGQSLKIEAIEIKCNKDLEVQEHIENVGWMPSSKGTNIRIGTEGKDLRLEAFKINIL